MSTDERDYVAEMLTIVKAGMAGPYVAADLAAETVAKLRATDPDLLIGFFGLDKTMVNGLRDWILTLNRGRRRNARRAAQRNETRERFERAVSTGDPALLRQSPPSLLAQKWVVNDEGLTIPYADTGKPERLYIIGTYQEIVRSNGLELAYHEAVQRKARNRITGDVFTEDSLAELRRGVVGDAA